VSEAIASWQRILRQTVGDKRDNFKRAAVELFRLAETGPTQQVIIDELADMAVIAAIEEDEAQEIVAQAHNAPKGTPGSNRVGTGKATGDKPTSVANVAFVAPDCPQIDEAAFHGFAGEAVRTIEPHSEADPIALLLQTLVFAGNIIGRRPHCQIGMRHYAKLLLSWWWRKAEDRRAPRRNM
jgi:hypothetical protein